MKTILVWVLVFYIDGYQAGGPAVVDNLATEADCQRIAARVRAEDSENRAVCAQGRKVVP